MNVPYVHFPHSLHTCEAHCPLTQSEVHQFLLFLAYVSHFPYPAFHVKGLPTHAVPEHALELQVPVSVAEQGHGLPPLDAGVATVLVRVLVPPPHLAEQVDHTPYSPHAQSTATTSLQLLHDLRQVSFTFPFVDESHTSVFAQTSSQYPDEAKKGTQPTSPLYT